MTNQATKSEQIWWLNPAWVAGLMGILVSVAAYTTPESMYLKQWKTPKYIDFDIFMVCIALSLLFAFGAAAAMMVAKKENPADWRRDLPWDLLERAFWLCVGLSIAGYMVWATVAVARGATLGLALAVIRGEKGAIYEMKEVYLGTISGVTTMTQLGIPAMILGVMISTVKGWKRVVGPIGLLFVLAIIRALFNAERLAIIELAVPLVVIALRLKVVESPRFRGGFKGLLQFAPIGGGVILLGIFGVFEYFRSWSSYYSGGDQSFWTFVVLRLTGYYVTALNNGALAISRLDTIDAPFSVLHFLWRFPITGKLMDAAYPAIKLDAARLDPYMQILDREANQEFNNSSALLPPVVDFGIPGALLFWLLAGVLCGLLYRWFLDGRASGLLLYPVFFTGVTETTRIMYWGEGRAVTAFLILLPLAWLCGTWAKRAYRDERRLIWQQSH